MNRDPFRFDKARENVPASSASDVERPDGFSPSPGASKKTVSIRSNKRRLWGSFRTLLMRLFARFHCALVVAIACAAVFEMLDGTGFSAYLRGLLFCIPMALSCYAAEKLPALWQFLLASLLISGLSWLLLGHPGGAVLAAVVCFFRGRARLSEEKSRSAFDVPTYMVLLVFLFFFCMSAVLGVSRLQKLSVISAAFYFLLCLAFRGVERIDGYLVLNRDMHGLPVRRIQRIAGGALCAAVLLCAALLLPAALNASGDFRIVIPDFPGAGNYVPPEMEKPREIEQTLSLAELFGEDDRPAFEIPPWVSYSLYAVALGGIAMAVLYGLYRIFKNFRASYTDSRDIVQFLSAESGEEELAEESKSSKRLPFFDRSPNAVVRRRYRKQVLRKASEPPKRWQSPAEIEAWAGLSNVQLHELYEKARYGSAPCTQEDIRALKEMSKSLRSAEK